MKLNRIFYILLLLPVILLSSCSEDEPSVPPNSILSFSFTAFDPTVEGQIDQQTKTITVEFPYGTDLTNLAPQIEVSPGSTVDPPSGEPQDFSDPILYIISDTEDNQKVYTVLSETGPSNENEILAFSFPDIFVDAVVDGNSISASVPYGTDVTSLVPDIEINAGATISPNDGVSQNFSSPVTYKVTAANGEIEDFSVKVIENEQQTAIRGVWITDVSSVLTSRANIIEAVEKVAELNMNTIFMVTWNQAMTTYPSDIMESLTGTKIDPRYGSRDPLQEMIEEAHARGIKVMAWFEYGFAANYASLDKSLSLSEQIQQSGGPVLQAKPEWAGVDQNGDLLEKNSFIWMNGLHPEVQEFMTSLMLEVVQNYDIDGVQGDDRLPAMPSEGGYDNYTVNRYQQEIGTIPPTGTKNSAWLQWRANILNEYAAHLYDTVKYTDPNVVVAMSPSPMNFGYVEYLQDWPAWVNNGNADIVSPQLYRRDNQGIGVYNNLLNNQLTKIDQDKVLTFYPGLLIALGPYSPSAEFFADMVQSNRANGVSGEVYFYYLGLNRNEDVIKALYPAPAIYPTF